MIHNVKSSGKPPIENFQKVSDTGFWGKHKVKILVGATIVAALAAIALAVVFWPAAFGVGAVCLIALPIAAKIGLVAAGGVLAGAGAINAARVAHKQDVCPPFVRDWKKQWDRDLTEAYSKPRRESAEESTAADLQGVYQRLENGVEQDNLDAISYQYENADLRPFRMKGEVECRFGRGESTASKRTKQQQLKKNLEAFVNRVFSGVGQTARESLLAHLLILPTQYFLNPLADVVANNITGPKNGIVATGQTGTAEINISKRILRSTFDIRTSLLFYLKDKTSAENIGALSVPVTCQLSANEQGIWSFRDVRYGRGDTISFTPISEIDRSPASSTDRSVAGLLDATNPVEQEGLSARSW